MRPINRVSQLIPTRSPYCALAGMSWLFSALPYSLPVRLKSLSVRYVFVYRLCHFAAANLDRFRLENQKCKLAKLQTASSEMGNWGFIGPISHSCNSCHDAPRNKTELNNNELCPMGNQPGSRQLLFQGSVTRIGYDQHGRN